MNRQPEGLQSRIKQFVAGLRRVISFLVIAFFGYMAVAVLVQIAGRYVFNFSIDWTAETATFAQIWMVLLAAGLAMQQNLHVNVDVLSNVVPETMRRTLIVVVAIACSGFLLLAFIGSLALIDIGRIQSSPVLQVPMWIPYLSLPVGLLYFGLELLLALAARWHLSQPDAPTP
jgi:TRAP-type C4-dicarboxylate transport system permease small subunit